MIYCDIVNAELQDFFDGELTRAEHKQIEQHLEQCSRCRRHAALFHSTFDILRHLPDTHPDPDYWEGAAKQVLQKIPA